MKQVIAAFLSALMLTSGACSQKSSGGNAAAPVDAPEVSSEQINRVDVQVESEQQAQADAQPSANNSGVSAFLVSQSLNKLANTAGIEFRGLKGEVLTIDDYRRNPLNSFVLRSVEDGYQVLRTTLDASTALATVLDSKLAKLNFEVYAVEGVKDNFDPASLSRLIFKDSLEVNLADKAATMNAIYALKDRFNNSELAENSQILNGLSNFFFPKAYAGNDKADDYLLVAIITSSVAVLSYIFAWYNVGYLSTGTAIVFWILYWIEND